MLQVYINLFEFVVLLPSRPRSYLYYYQGWFHQIRGLYLMPIEHELSFVVNLGMVALL